MYRFFENTANNHPNRIAVYQGNRGYTYAEIAGRVHRLTDALHSVPTRQGDRVLIAFTNVLEFIPAYFAVLEAACIPVLVNTDTPAAKVAAVIDDVAAVGIIGHSRLFITLPAPSPSVRFAFLDGPAPRTLSHIQTCQCLKALKPVSSARTERAVSKPIDSTPEGASKTIIFTSGTTGPPKGVVLSYANIDYSTEVMIDFLKLTPHDRVLVSIPFTHCAGLLHLLAHIRSGGTLVTGENPALPGSFLKAVHRQGVTGLPAVPSLFGSFLPRYKDGLAKYCSKLRYIELSSEPYDLELMETLLKALPGVAFYNTYGLTEAPRATYHDIREHTAASLSVGTPNRDVKIRIVNPRGIPCSPGEIGEIYIQGPNVAAGYWNRPSKTETAFTSQGFNTGDLACRGAGGKIYLHGRIDNPE